MNKFVLASSSPRRQELLKFIIDDFDVITYDVDESTDLVDPEDVVKFLSRKKAKATHNNLEGDRVVIGSDTVVVLDDQILGKPLDKSDAKNMLKSLSGKSHYVYTGFCILHGDDEILGFEKTEVIFSDLSKTEIDDYIQTGEPMDKAGSYGIQGFGSKFISKIDGCYFCVMGFPVNRIYNELKNARLL